MGPAHSHWWRTRAFGSMASSHLARGLGRQSGASRVAPARFLPHSFGGQVGIATAGVGSLLADSVGRHVGGPVEARDIDAHHLLLVERAQMVLDHALRHADDVVALPILDQA